MAIIQEDIGRLPSGAGDSPSSAVRWAPVFAGAVGATALTLLLTILGTGLGLTMVSPFSGESYSSGTVAISAAIWLIVIQWLASAFGGYLAGRLRTRWASVHEDETFFRDTAHGFLSWALATVFVASVLGSTLTSLIGGGVSAATSVTSGLVQGAAQGAASNEQLTSSAANADPSAYFLDMMFRPAENAAPGTPPSNPADARQEASRILLAGAAAGEIPAADKTYLAQIVARNTGLPQAEAEKRVNDVLAQADAAAQKAKEAADTARKAGATMAIMTFIALLIGAFVASVAAAIGGRQRDDFESANPI